MQGAVTKSHRRAAVHASAALPLAGASVVVTRPVGQGATLRRRIDALGGRPLSLPGSRLQAMAVTAALRAQLRRAGSADRVIFASPAAVRFAFAALPALRFARGVQVLAVGAATARALLRRGIAGVIAPARQDSEGLLARAELKRLQGVTVALIGAPQGRELLPQTLTRRGAQLQRIEVYRRQPARLDQRHFGALATVTGPCLVLLSSTQTLAHFAATLPSTCWQKLCQGEAIASSARIAVAARTHGFASVTLARSPGAVDLLAAAAAALARHRL